MGYIVGKTHVEAQQWGRGWVAFWAGFGHTNLRVVCGPDRKRIEFATKADALVAGLAALQAHEPDIRTMAPAKAAQPLADKLASEVVDFEQRRTRQAVEDRRVFRGLGKGFVDVQVVKRSLS